jgi:hypothetical protein
MPNPYDKLPDEDYMQTLIATVGSGKPLFGEPGAFRGGGGKPSSPSLKAPDTNYSSVALEWTPSGTTFDFAMYLYGTMQVAYFPCTMTRAVIPGIGRDTLSFPWEYSERAIGLTEPIRPFEYC